MMTSLIDVDSLLAIDVGSVNTRAFLFDVANGAYRFLAAGVAPTTVQGAFNNISDGVHMALEHLQEITGRTLIGNDGHLIVPTHADGTGVDALMCTLSAGPAVQTAVVGLLADVSLESIQRLAASTYSHVVEAIGLTDRRGPLRRRARYRLHFQLAADLDGSSQPARRSRAAAGHHP